MKTDKNLPDYSPLSFSTLKEIMERLATVSYEQFQAELQAWFEQGLQSQGRDFHTLQQEGLPNLPDLISRIYHMAEIQHTLSENQITLSHDAY